MTYNVIYIKTVNRTTELKIQSGTEAISILSQM